MMIKSYFKFSDPLILIPLICITLSISGCLSQIASVDEMGRSWIGHTFDELKNRRPSLHKEKYNLKEETEILNDGSILYIDPVTIGCVVYWSINTDGIITAYKAEGEQCP